jgi:aryl-alcohol dehydrogenase-like predicted oxidoreductase
MPQDGGGSLPYSAVRRAARALARAACSRLRRGTPSRGRPDAKPAEVALAWLLRNPVVSTTIVGPLTIEELTSDLSALSVQLDDHVVERLDQIWPGPGEAPQAYAW